MNERKYELVQYIPICHLHNRSTYIHARLQQVYHEVENRSTAGATCCYKIVDPRFVCTQEYTTREIVCICYAQLLSVRFFSL